MLTPGDSSEFRYLIPATKTVPYLYPESPEFQAIPPVFATGFMVGLMEWACILHLHPHLGEHQTSLGIHIDVSHCAASTPGMEVTVKVKVTEVEGKRITWQVEAHDGVDLIGQGRHQRAFVTREKFEAGVTAKAASLGLDFPAAE